MQIGLMFQMYLILHQKQCQGVRDELRGRVCTCVRKRPGFSPSTKVGKIPSTNSHWAITCAASRIFCCLALNSRTSHLMVRSRRQGDLRPQGVLESLYSGIVPIRKEVTLVHSPGAEIVAHKVTSKCDFILLDFGRRSKVSHSILKPTEIYTSNI